MMGRLPVKSVAISAELECDSDSITFSVKDINKIPASSNANCRTSGLHCRTHPVAVRGNNFRDLSPFSSSPCLRLFDWRSIGVGDDIGGADDHDRERDSLNHALSN